MAGDGNCLNGHADRPQEVVPGEPEKTDAEKELVEDNKISSSPSAEYKNTEESVDLMLTEKETSFAEDILQNFLLEMFGKSNSKVFEILKESGEKLLFDSDDTVLKKGDRNKGLFMILSGSVNVMTSDGTIFRTLHCGDVFGEISTVFHIPATASVTVLSPVVLVHLPQPILNLLTDVSLKDPDITDWCVHRRYLPTGGVIDMARTYRRLALNILRHFPLFESWPEDMIKNLILSFEHSIVTLYPPGSTILLEDDPLTSLYIVIHGTIAIFRKNKLIKEIQIKHTNEPFIFTEIAILFKNRSSPVTIKTKLSTQVIQVKTAWIFSVIEKHPDVTKYDEKAELYETHIQRLGPLFIKYLPDLQLDILCNLLKRNQLYCDDTHNVLERNVLRSEFQEIGIDENALLDTERGQYEALMIIRGKIGLKSKTFICYKSASLTDVTNDAETIETVRPKSEEAINKAKNSEFSDHSPAKTKKTLSPLLVIQEGEIIAVESFQERYATARALTECLVMKIMKRDKGDSEQATEVKSIKSETPQSTLRTSLDFI